MGIASSIALADALQIDPDDIPTSLNLAVDQLIQQVQQLEDPVGVTDGLAAASACLQVLGREDLARVYRAVAVVIFTLDVYGVGGGDG